MKTIKNAAKASAIAAVLTASAMTGASAATVTLDFSGEMLGSITGDTFNTSLGGLDFAFSGLGLMFRTLPPAFTAEYGLDIWLSTTFDSEPITMEISGATINSVTYLNPINGTVSGEVDVITAEAFDSTATLIDSASNGDETNTLNGDISTIVFDGVLTGYVLGEFIVDFDPIPSAVPLPAGFPLLLAGLGGLALVRRRKNRT